MHPKMMELENIFMADFDERMKILTDKYNVEYINFKESGDRYKYIDGDHLYKLSGAVVSSEIAHYIIKTQTQKHH